MDKNDLKDEEIEKKEVQVENVVEDNKEVQTENIVEESKEVQNENIVEEKTETQTEKESEEKTEAGTDLIKVETENNDEKNEIKNAKLGERISLAFRKRWMVSGTITLLLVLCIIAAYISVNLWAADNDLPNFDITESHIFTLSEESKKAIKDINKEITIYTYGYEEDAAFIKFVKQYTTVNPNIKWSVLNNETNMELLNEIGDSYQSTLVIVVCGEKRIFVTPESDFSTSDFATGNTIDTTEEKMTNTILSLAEENQPNIFFTTGHNEFIPAEEGLIQNLGVSLKDEAYNVEVINLGTTDIPDTCDILAIVSPASDLSEAEANKVIAYINKGKNLFISKDMGKEINAQFPNLQKVLDLYGVTIDNSGYIVETSLARAYSSKEQNGATPIIFYPDLSSTHEITSDLYNEQSRNPVLMTFSGRLKYVDDSTLANLNVSKEMIVSSSETSGFATDFSKDVQQAISTAEMGVCDIGAVLTKTISSPSAEPAAPEETTTEETATEENKTEDSSKNLTSKLIVFASSSFFNDAQSYVNTDYPNIYIGNNRDLILNSFSYLSNKEYTMTIRKTSASSSYAYVPSENQKKVVLLIIFLYPVVIVLIGALIFAYRRVRK